MAKTKKRSVKPKSSETNTAYMLKLVLYLIIGSQWLRISHGTGELPIPIGFIIGMLFTMHEHFQIDRKIEYAVLLMALFIGFWLPMGINVGIR
jgi:hypothetical protein